MQQPIVYLNGTFLPLDQAKVSVLDRGFVFGDGVYEVIPVYQRRPFRLSEHLTRLQNSLDAIRISNPLSDTDWQSLITQMIEKHDVDDQSIYLQITRGIAKRDHAFPAEIEPTVFVMSNPLTVTDEVSFNKGVAAITLDDIRWQYCNIKAIALLPNILSRQAAVDKGAQEAILIRDNDVTEGAASNIFIVKDGVIKTPPKTSRLLPGITRDLIVELAASHQLACEETAISADELQQADEIWLTSSTKEILPVVTLDDRTIGNGKPGPISQKMYGIFQGYKAQLKQANA